MNNNVSHCKMIEDLRNEAAKEAAKLEAYNIALKLLQRGKETIEEISEVTELTLEEVKELKACASEVTA